MVPAVRGAVAAIDPEQPVHTIRTLPYLQHDEKDPEDLDTEAEDHAADETRYAVMSRVGVRDEEPAAASIRYPKNPSEMTINELIARQRVRDRASAPL